MSLKAPSPATALAAVTLALACPWAAAQSTAAAAEAQPAAKRVAIDPATGRIRPMELDDAVQAGPAPAAAAARSAAPSANARGVGPARLKSAEVVSATGVRGMRVGAEHLNYTRVTRNADGTLAATCTVGESADAHAQHAAAIVRRSAVQPGARDVE